MINFFLNLLNHNFEKPTIISIFPGIGSGKRYVEFSGCTLQTKYLENIANKYTNINFIGISSQNIPKNTNNIIYHKLENINKFESKIKDNEIFYLRVTYIINNNKIIKFSNSDYIEHVNFINDFCTNIK